MEDRPSNQSGGVNITNSSVNVTHGDIVGGSKTTFSPQQLDRVFEPLLEAVQSAKPEQQAEARDHVEKLKQEVSKGSSANDKTVASLLDRLVGLVPGAVTAIVSAFGTPLLAGVAGPATEWVLEKIQGA
jgi:hypothetical protein